MTASKRGRIMDAIEALCRDFRAFSKKIFFTLPPTHNATREREHARPSHGQQAASMGPLFGFAWLHGPQTAVSCQR
jgi:hypothetical protein